MNLKVKTEAVHVVELNDLEQFIRQTTGHTYEIVPNEEWGNDQYHRFEIDDKLGGYKKEEWEAFKLTGVEHQYRLHTILSGLCMDGHLAPGIYLINVSW